MFRSSATIPAGEFRIAAHVCNPEPIFFFPNRRKRCAGFHRRRLFPFVNAGGHLSWLTSEMSHAHPERGRSFERGFHERKRTGGERWLWRLVRRFFHRRPHAPALHEKSERRQ